MTTEWSVCYGAVRKYPVKNEQKKTIKELSDADLAVVAGGGVINPQPLPPSPPPRFRLM
jgi:hypothetical protein